MKLFGVVILNKYITTNRISESCNTEKLIYENMTYYTKTWFQMHKLSQILVVVDYSNNETIKIIILKQETN